MLYSPGYPDKVLYTLQLVLNVTARILTRTQKSDHITPVLASLHCLPVKARADFNILLLTYRALHGLAPTYLFYLVLPYTPTCMLRSQDAGLLIVPRISKQTAGGRLFLFLWNGLQYWPLSLYCRIISSVGPMTECSLAQGCEGERHLLSQPLNGRLWEANWYFLPRYWAVAPSTTTGYYLTPLIIYEHLNVLKNNLVLNGHVLL
jgi:hypothetical protein